MSRLEINEVRKFGPDYFLMFPLGKTIYMWMKHKGFWQRVESFHYHAVKNMGVLVAKNHILHDAFEYRLPRKHFEIKS